MRLIAHTLTHTHTHPLTLTKIATCVVASSNVGIALPTVLGHHRYSSTVAGEMGSPITVPQVSPATVAWKYWEREGPETEDQERLIIRSQDIDVKLTRDEIHINTIELMIKYRHDTRRLRSPHRHLVCWEHSSSH